MASSGQGGWNGSPVDAVARRLANLHGWRRHAAAAGFGAVATLALPPVYLLPVLYVAFAGLVWMLPAGLRKRTAFFTGWWFGMGYFVASLYWIGFAPITKFESGQKIRNLLSLSTAT